MKLAVAEAAVDAGASYVNDVTAFRHDPELAGFVADRGLDCCLMHMLGEPRTMQRDPRYGDVVAEVKAFLAERMEAAIARGRAGGADPARPRDRLRQDASSTTSSCCAGCDELTDLGRPLVIGTSRKSFLGPDHRPRRRPSACTATVATCVMALERGARVFRVHDVAAVADALKVAAATLSPAWPRRARGLRRRRPDDDDDDEEGPEVGVTIEIVGLSLYTHHGVTAEERKIGQRLVLDVRFDVGEPDALITDRVEDTVDYGEVCQVIALIAQRSPTGRSSACAR